MMKHIVAALVGAVIALAFVTVRFSYRIYNLERQQLRIEQEYQAVITENHKLVRLNETNLRLLTQGGWNEVPFVCTSDH